MGSLVSEQIWLIECSSLDRVTSYGKEKDLNLKSVVCYLGEFIDNLHLFAVYLHHYRQIRCVGGPTISLKYLYKPKVRALLAFEVAYLETAQKHLIPFCNGESPEASLVEEEIFIKM